MDKRMFVGHAVIAVSGVLFAMSTGCAVESTTSDAVHVAPASTNDDLRPSCVPTKGGVDGFDAELGLKTGCGAGAGGGGGGPQIIDGWEGAHFWDGNSGEPAGTHTGAGSSGGGSGPSPAQCSAAYGICLRSCPPTLPQFRPARAACVERCGTALTACKRNE